VEHKRTAWVRRDVRKTDMRGSQPFLTLVVRSRRAEDWPAAQEAAAAADQPKVFAGIS
jgi:hypothetical protein